MPGGVYGTLGVHEKMFNLKTQYPGSAGDAEAVKTITDAINALGEDWHVTKVEIAQNCVVAMQIPGKQKHYFVSFNSGRGTVYGDWGSEPNKAALNVKRMTAEEAIHVAEVLRGNETGAGIVTIEFI